MKMKEKEEQQQQKRVECRLTLRCVFCFFFLCSYVLFSNSKKNGKGAGKPQQAASAGQRVMKNEGDNELEVKRMKRLLRNRVSAQLARERKKQYVLGLEKKSKESDKKIKDLQDMVKALTKENELLKVQLEQHQQAKVGTAMVPES